MRYNILFVSCVLLVLVSWMKTTISDYPSPPDKYTSISKVVNLKFKVTVKDMNSVEMALNEGGGPNNLFVVFDLSENWASGDFGLILKSMSDKNSLQTRSGSKPDISRFENDNKGKQVEFYTFSQELISDENGKTFIKMIYTGPDMPLIKSLTVASNFQLPRSIAARFVNNGSIVFQAGNYGLDQNIKGFWIPVKVS